MGKSDTFKSDYTAQKTELESTTTQVIFKACTELGAEAGILQFFNSDLIENWRTGEGELILFLDGFDEGMLFAASWPSLLISSLQKLPSERLRLRVSCRPAVWPESIESRLAEAFTLNDLPVYSLAPLSEEHVRIAAESEAVDDVAFLAEVARKAAVPFAIKPLTLVFLLRTYKESNSLPTSHVALFRENCVRLCDEVNRTRLEVNQAGELSAHERYSVAKAFAGVSIFCNRPFFAKTALDQINYQTSQAADFNTVMPVLPPGTTYSDYKEVLNTGLFSARGEQMLGWAQQTFAEFLAAEWVSSSTLRNKDLWELTTNDDGEARRIVPQLVTVAAWLSEMKPGYRKRVLEKDPTVLLNADETALDSKTRKKLVKQVLAAVEAGVPSHTIRDGFYKLLHSGLPKQLRPFIRNRKRSVQVRRAAIMIAERCNLKALENDLLRLALNENEEHSLRSSAIFSISHFGTADARLALRTLACSENDADIDDDLKGWSLYALWPVHIDAMSVLHCLTPPKRSNYLGGYGSFIYTFADAVGGSLTPSSVPLALNWATEFGNKSTKLSYVSDAIVVHAFQTIAVKDVARALAELVVTRTEQHDEVIANFGVLTRRERFRDLLQQHPAERQLLARFVIAVAAERDISPHRFWSAGIFLSDDAGTYADAYNERGPKEKEFILELLSWLPLTPKFASSIRPAIDSGLLPKDLTKLFHVEFGSPNERPQRERYRLEQEYSPKPRKRFVPTAKERIASRLNEIEGGKADSWIWLTCEDMLLGEYEGDIHDIEADITQSAVWESLDDTTKSRIVNAAQLYALSVKPYSLEFIPTNSIPWWATAEYQALLLLLKSGLWSKLLKAEGSSWERWSAISIWYPFDRSEESRRQLVRTLAERPDFANGARTVLSFMKQAQTCYGVPKHIIFGWNNGVRDLILELGRTNALPPSCARELLALACERDQASFVPFLSERLEHSLEHHAPVPEISYWAGILLDGQAELFWRDRWSRLRDDARVELLVSLASGSSSKVFDKISNDALIQIYLLLETRYPHYDDPKHDGGAYAVGTRDQIADFRNGALEIMKRRGLVKGFDAALLKFGYPWLKTYRQDALKNRRQLTWSAWPPLRLFELLSESQKDPLETPSVQFMVGILGNLAASLLFPELMTRTERAFYSVFVITAILFALNYRKLWRKGRRIWMTLLAAISIYLCSELMYFLYFRTNSHP